MRRSISPSPGNGTSSCAGMVFTKGRVDGLGRGDAKFGSAVQKLFDDVGGAVRAGFIDDLLKGLKPFRSLLWIQVRLPFFFGLEHVLDLDRGQILR